VINRWQRQDGTVDAKPSVNRKQKYGCGLLLCPVGMDGGRSVLVWPMLRPAWKAGRVVGHGDPPGDAASWWRR
jgi:hypothetical protein